MPLWSYIGPHRLHPSALSEALREPATQLLLWSGISAGVGCIAGI